MSAFEATDRTVRSIPQSRLLQAPPLYIALAGCSTAKRLGASSVALVLFVALQMLCSTPVQSQTAFCGTVAVGIYASGFNCAPAAGATATISTSSGDQITTAAGVAVRAAAQNADAAVSIAGTGITSNVVALANGVEARVTNGVGNASVTFSGANSISLGSGGDNGVFVQNNTAGNSSVSVSAGASLIITNANNTGSERDGIELNSTGSGNASMIYDGSGSISTVNGNGFWIKAANGGSAFVEAGDGLSFSISKPAAGGNYAGIHTNVLGTGSTTIVTGASIQSSGTNAYGIYTQAATGSTSITNSGAITTSGLNGFGIRSATSGNGDIAISNAGSITTTGLGAHGIYLTSQGGTISVENNGAISVGSASATEGSRGIYINAFVAGNINVTGSGDITVLGNTATPRGHAIIVNALTGNVNVDYSGALTSSGNGAGGIRADAQQGSVQVNYGGSRIETFNQDGTGIYASSRSATAPVEVTAGGTIVTHANAGSGDGSGSGAFGLEGISYGGNVRVAFTGSQIDVNGSGAAILAANAYFTGTGLGTVTVENSGDVLARGDRQQGIRTFSTTGAQTIDNAGGIRTLGATDSQGIWAITNGASPVTIVNSGAITTIGNNSSGIDAVSQGGAVALINRADIAAGWGSSAGLQFGGATQAVDNLGTIQALSDVALRGDAQGFSGAIAISNSGVITGAVSASTSIVRIDNEGTWMLRNFADSDGDQVRDRLAVAVSDLGTSGTNVINNSGTIALTGRGGASAQTLDTTGQYLPFGFAFNAMRLNSPVQGQILGVQTFNNSGTIDLGANFENGNPAAPVVGDVLVISGGHTAGINGGGVFVANGGLVRFDTNLNEGGANSQSDILVVDGTRLGSAKTGLAVTNVGGPGAITVGNGIALVEVLNKSASDPTVFTLAGRVAAGPYEYALFHGGVGADAQDGNWYLRSSIDCRSDPTNPICRIEPPSPSPDPIPDYRTETSLYSAIPSLTLLYGRALLDTLHERVGEEEDQRQRPISSNGSLGWGRIIGVNGHQSGDAIGIFGTGPSYNYSFLGLQAGMDVFRRDRADGSRDQAGAYFAIGGDQGRVSHVDGSQGNSNFNAYTFGGYWTHFGASGWYTDAILQGTFYDISSSADRGLPALRTGAQGAAASIEAGYPFKFGAGYFIEPQAQLVYQNVHINDARDVDSQVFFSDVASLAARIGARLGRTWAIEGSQRTITAWIRPNLWNEFLGNPVTSFSSETGLIPFRADLRGLWGEINVGVSGQVSTSTTLYANASYSSRFDSGGFSYTGKAGLRVNW
jgi:autotransporter family porin